jgi:predicted phage baseplate assembly protein
MLTGTLRVTVRDAAPQDVTTTFFYLNATSIAVAMYADFDLVGIVRDDDRVIVLPSLPVHEPRAYLRLFLDADPPPALSGASAVLLGNVAPASHGETVRREVLGDGDAAQIFQRFDLKKKLLTRVPGAVPGGIQSTLQVLVNGVLWDEKPTLYGAGPRDQIYVSRMADDGTASIRFGDGKMGARPDTGRQNIVASYRHGTGLVGRVAARQLSNLVDRPTGVKGVINLLPSDGGADPESLAHARETAPGSVRTFGRAVSLRDFEDLSLMAGEVAKSAADWVWSGDRRVIHLTVAAQGGALFSADGLARLLAMLSTERDPNHKLVIANYAAVAVRVTAHLTVNPRHLNDVVLGAARAALLDALSFERRRFAEPVYLSDMYRVLQDVEGVVAVDIDALDLKSSDAGFRAAHGVDDTLPQPQRRLLMLPARPAGGSSPGILPAEIAWVEIPSQDVLLTASGGLEQ